MQNNTFLRWVRFFSLLALFTLYYLSIALICWIQLSPKFFALQLIKEYSGLFVLGFFSGLIVSISAIASLMPALNYYLHTHYFNKRRLLASLALLFLWFILALFPLILIKGFLFSQYIQSELSLAIILVILAGFTFLRFRQHQLLGF